VGDVIARSIIEMRDAHPSMFHGQDWYDDEPFAHLRLPPLIGLPTHLVRCPHVPTHDQVDHLTDAVLLVDLYLRYPHEAMFHGELWAADRDRQGNQVFVGCTSNGRGLEIHRRLEDMSRYSIPVWR
jgi:hypothetical protein